MQKLPLKPSTLLWIGAGIALFMVLRSKRTECPEGYRFDGPTGKCVLAEVGMPPDVGNGGAGMTGGVREGDVCNGLGWRWKRGKNGFLVCGGSGLWPW